MEGATAIDPALQYRDEMSNFVPPCMRNMASVITLAETQMS